MFFKKNVLLFAGLILAVIMAAGCATKKNPWGDPDTGLILQYRMIDNQSLTYQTATDFLMNMEIMGQPMEIKANDSSAFSITSKGLQENNYQLGITIDSWEMHVTTPQGDLAPDMSGIVGKSFDMTLSLLGKEVDVSGAESLQYEVAPGQTQSIGTTFQALFPDLPAKPVKIGDTWTSEDTVTEKSSTGELIIQTSGTNTLEGFESVDGMECARITATFTGTLKGEGNQGGMDLVTEGDIEGSDTWYFAYKKGIFVKSTMNGKAKGTITGSGPRTITIPMTREFTMETKLIQ